MFNDVSKLINRVSDIENAYSRIISEVHSTVQKKSIKEVLNQYASILNSSQRYYKRIITDVDDFDALELPEEFSWDNSNGYNYLPKVVN